MHGVYYLSDAETDSDATGTVHLILKTFEYCIL